MTRIAIMLVVAALGCQRKSELFCENHPEMCTDGSTEGQTCGMCVAPKLACDTDTNMCVECNTSVECSGAMPVCDQHACRACVAHTECPSAACLPDGTCARVDDVAYVADNGVDNGMCDSSNPCARVGAGLATHKPVIKVTGTINEAVVIDVSTSALTIVGAPGAKLTFNGAGGSVVNVASGNPVTIADIEIGGTATVKSNNFGVTLTGGTLSLKHVLVNFCNNGGIKVSAGQLTVHQSTIANNDFGGIDIDGPGATFELSNNFIYRNGDRNSGVVGGIRVLQFANGGNNRIEFNTIVDNQMQNTGTQAGGLYCLMTIPTANNIVARNAVGTNFSLPNSNQYGDCMPLTSYVSSDIAPLDFAHPDNLPFDYHIQTGSAAIDMGTTMTTITYDFDGKHRPAHAANDQGANEVQ